MAGNRISNRLMRYFVLATDYDGTIAEEGVVHPNTLKALEKLRQTGRHVVLVTGRVLPDLMATFPQYEVFRLIVAENGALLYDPSTKAETILCEAPSEEFAKKLAEKGVAPLGQGRVIVETLENQKEAVLDTIQELGLELQMIFNKGSLMVLPSGVNKATGLRKALERICLSPHNTVAVGDAENDHAFLSACERGVSVANGLPALKERADFVTTEAAGAGVSELVGLLVDADLASIPAKGDRDTILLGESDGGEIRVPAYGSTLLLAGTSGGGKSTLTTGVMERLRDAEYQFLAIDPEGDYQNFDGALVLGDSKRAPTVDEILAVLEDPKQSLIANLLGMHLDDRPAFFESLMPRVQALRSRTGRPHWIILDEAHHLAPADRGKSGDALPKDLISAMLITLEPERLPESVLGAIDTVIAVGEKPGETIRAFCKACELNCPRVPEGPLERGKALLWSRTGGAEPRLFAVTACRTDRVRHSRKYASAELTPDRSFFFKGPQGKLNLRAPNLITFVRLLEGVDDETWLFHLRKGEYSEWFRENIKNDELADAAANIEGQTQLPPEQSKGQIKEQIEQRFTLPG